MDISITCNVPNTPERMNEKLLVLVPFNHQD